MMNARAICLGLGLVLTAGVAWAQPEVEWERTYGGDNSEKCFSIVQPSQGGFALVGQTISNGAGSGDVWFILTDDNGNNPTPHRYGGNRNDICQDVIETSDGGFALGGTTLSFGAGSWDFWLIKTDSVGDSIWSQTFGSNRLEVCNSIVQTRDGGFAMAGYCEPTGDGTYDFLLLRTDSNGDSLWSQTYLGAGNDACFSVIEMDDGGFALAGYTGSYGAYGYDFWLVRTNEDGDSLWSRTYGGEDFECCYSMIQTQDRGFALAGYTQSFGAGNYDFWLVRTNDNGDSLWSQTFGGANSSICRSLTQTPDGGFALSGVTNSFGEGGYDCMLVRTDSQGERLWSRTFGSWNDDQCFSMIQTSEGGFALAGYTFSLGDHVGSNDFQLFKTTPDPVSVRDSRSTLNPLTFSLYAAYPNPFNSTVTIPFGVGAWHAVPLQLAIFDPLGRRVANLIPSGSGELIRRYSAAGRHSVVWDASGVPAGQYVVRMEAGNDQLTQRLSLVK